MKKAVRHLKPSEAGFTLIELMITAAIISILSSIAVPAFKDFVGKAKQAEAKSALAGLYSAERIFANEWGGFTGDLRDIGFLAEGRPITYDLGFSAAGWFPPGPVVPQGSATCSPRTAYNTEVSACALTPGSVQARAPFQAAPAGNGCGGGAVPTQRTFRATAVAILFETRLDIWTIDQNKRLCNNLRGF